MGETKIGHKWTSSNITHFLMGNFKTQSLADRWFGAVEPFVIV